MGPAAGMSRRTQARRACLCFHVRINRAQIYQRFYASNRPFKMGSEGRMLYRHRKSREDLEASQEHGDGKRCFSSVAAAPRQALEGGPRPVTTAPAPPAPERAAQHGGPSPVPVSRLVWREARSSDDGGWLSGPGESPFREPLPRGASSATSASPRAGVQATTAHRQV